MEPVQASPAWSLPGGAAAPSASSPPESPACVARAEGFSLDAGSLVGDGLTPGCSEDFLILVASL